MRRTKSLRNMKLPFKQSQHQQIALGVGRGDLAAQFPHPRGDRLFVEDDALELTPAGLPQLRRAG